MIRPADAWDIAAAAQLACLLEASAPKPGNVSPGRSFGDTRYEDFLASAAAIGAPLGSAAIRPLGETIRLAIDGTRRWTRSNTNLGIVLLFAPLARAAHASSALASRESLRGALQRVLDETTVDDARRVYATIRLVSPGGLGRVESEDVADEPTLTLRAAMRLAAHRDGIAREYDTAFDTTFRIGAPTLERARRDGLGWDDAIVETYLTLLAATPDTHIVRRVGAEVARAVSHQARAVLDAGSVFTAGGRAALARMDAALRDAHNSANPGTTADLTAAAIYVVLLRGGWQTGKGGLDAASR